MPATKTKAKPQPTGKTKKNARRPERKLPRAATEDRHDLYQKAVQCVESEIDFVDEKFQEIRGRKAKLLREDFGGTGNTSCEWVRRRKGNRAITVDIDKATLEWGREHNVGKLPPEAQKRVEMRCEDVRKVKTAAPDIILAMNFSYFIFEQRDVLLSYFKSVRRALAEDGIFFLDCYGGYDSFKETRERRELDDGVTYVWEQARYNPITGHMVCYIHFHFDDGSKMRKAFHYEWRMWTLPEIRELLDEAGFSKVTIYWEGTDENGEGDGNFEPATEADADPSWVCYIVAEK